MKRLITWISFVIVLLVGGCGGGSNTSTFIPEGVLDNTFGTAGIAKGSNIKAGTVSSGYIMDLTEDDQQRIVAVGNIQGKAAIWRFNANGDPDMTFGTAGRVDLDTDRLYAVSMDEDKIIAVGSSALNQSGIIWKLDSNGLPDATFGINGVVELYPGGNTEYLRDVIVKDHRIITIGSTGTTPRGMLIAQLNADGSMDDTFGSNGVVTITDTSVSYRGDGLTMVDSGGSEYIIAAGSKSTAGNRIPYVVRLTKRGSIVLPNTELPKTDPRSYLNAVTSVGAYYYAAGYELNATTNKNELKIWSAKGVDGTMQDTFGNHGMVTIDTLSENGSIYPRMVYNGIRSYDIATSHNGYLYIIGDISESGNSKGFIMRMDPTGTVDTDLSDNGVLILEDIDHIDAIKIDSSGKVIMGGQDYNGSVTIPIVVRLR